MGTVVYSTQTGVNVAFVRVYFQPQIWLNIYMVNGGVNSQ